MPRQKLATSELAAASLGETMVSRPDWRWGLEVEAERWLVGWERGIVKEEVVGLAQQVWE